MKRPFRIAASAICLTALSLISTSVAAKQQPPYERLQQLEAEFSARLQHFNEMPNQTPAEVEAVVAEGYKIKQLAAAKEKVRREMDPDDELHFLNSLESYLAGTRDSVIELRERAERDHNPEYLKKADQAEQTIAKFERGKQAYLNKEKTVRQLRKELGLPVHPL